MFKEGVTNRIESYSQGLRDVLPRVSTLPASVAGRVRKNISPGLRMLPLLAIAVACAPVGLIDVSQKEQDFNQRILGSLQPGSEVDILQGTFEIGSYINRRKWDTVLDTLIPPQSNLAYTDSGERVLNPLFHPASELQDNGLENGAGWLVYFGPDDHRLVAVGVDDNTNLNILGPGQRTGIRARLSELLKRVTISSADQTKGRYYFDQEAPSPSGHAIGVAFTTSRK